MRSEHKRRLVEGDFESADPSKAHEPAAYSQQRPWSPEERKAVGWSHWDEGSS
jgi:hypothetical protein